MERAVSHLQSQDQQQLFPLSEISTPVISPPSFSDEQKKSLSDALHAAVPVLHKEQFPEDKEITQARKILGPSAENLSAEEIKEIITEVSYLVDSWLDDFERQLFKGSTLREVLHEKGKL